MQRLASSDLDRARMALTTRYEDSLLDALEATWKLASPEARVESMRAIQDGGAAMTANVFRYLRALGVS